MKTAYFAGGCFWCITPTFKEIEGVAKIGIEDFAKVDLRVAKIVECEPVKKAKKLLKLTVFDGAGNRTVLYSRSRRYMGT